VDWERVREFATRYTAAWCSGDPARVVEFFAAGGSLAINDGEPAVGSNAIAESARSFMTAFPDLRVSMDGVRESNEGIEYHWTLDGTNTGPEGTGNHVRVSGFELWRFDAEGRIATSKGHFDQADFDRQLQSRGEN